MSVASEKMGKSWDSSSFEMLVSLGFWKDIFQTVFFKTFAEENESIIDSWKISNPLRWMQFVVGFTATIAMAIPKLTLTGLHALLRGYSPFKLLSEEYEAFVSPLITVAAGSLGIFAKAFEYFAKAVVAVALWTGKIAEKIFSPMVKPIVSRVSKIFSKSKDVYVIASSGEQYPVDEDNILFYDQYMHVASPVVPESEKENTNPILEVHLPSAVGSVNNSDLIRPVKNSSTSVIQSLMSYGKNILNSLPPTSEDLSLVIEHIYLSPIKCWMRSKDDAQSTSSGSSANSLSEIIPAAPIKTNN